MCYSPQKIPPRDVVRSRGPLQDDAVPPLFRTTNLLERTFAESRRRTKVIPRFPGEQACLRLVFATLITAAKKWRGVKMTPQIRRALDRLRVEAPGTGEQAAA